MPDFYPATVAPATRALFEKLSPAPWLKDFYLAGGTALALQLGHRTSVDLDFFTETTFNENNLVQNLSSFGDLQILQRDAQSITGILNGVKFSFIGYRYPMLKTPIDFEGVQIASVDDIACMKLDALSSRGTKRDFIDVYCIAERILLSKQLELFAEKYVSIGFNLVHLKKSLVYFEDAESDPMPAMIVPLDWKNVKQFFINETTGI